MYSYSMTTNIGARACNEDCAVCLVQNGNYCFVVADGLGGHGKGELASQMLVSVFSRLFRSGAAGAGNFLETAFEAAQEEILAAQKATNSAFEMKTTAVALTIVDGICRWGHIGDSRLYMLRKNKVRLRTLDHSVPQMLVIAKEIRERDIPRHPDRNRLLRVVGAEWGVSKYELSEEYGISDCPAFLLCSDGFWEHIDVKKIEKISKKSTTAQEWLTMMTKEVEAAGNNGDMDNYTAIAIRQ